MQKRRAGTFRSLSVHRIQLGSALEYRGRILALYTLIMQGSTPLGALLVGWTAQHLGARSGLCMGGLVSLVVALCALALDRSRSRSEERRTARTSGEGAEASPHGGLHAPP
ncbi:hypothetical protein ABZY05_25085 [Streptomyces canus]|uniref:hypothetical protein n=1 Tax=Streptomyces canus TaxID=58343 RepID=UPI0033A4EBF6